MKRATKIAIGVATALTFATAATVVSAQGYGPGPGSGPGMGQGAGYGPGPGMMQGPGYGHGYGPGPGMGRGMGPGGPGSMGYGPMGRGMGPQGQRDPSAMADARNAYLKSVLKITPAQESAWKAFADQKKQQVESMLAFRASAQGSAPATAPERLALRTQHMKQRQEQMEKTSTAFTKLYAALNAEQKAYLDQRVGMHRGMRGGWGGPPNRSGS